MGLPGPVGPGRSWSVLVGPGDEPKSGVEYSCGPRTRHEDYSPGVKHLLHFISS